MRKTTKKRGGDLPSASGILALPEIPDEDRNLQMLRQERENLVNTLAMHYMGINCLSDDDAQAIYDRILEIDNILQQGGSMEKKKRGTRRGHRQSHRQSHRRGRGQTRKRKAKAATKTSRLSSNVYHMLKDREHGVSNGIRKKKFKRDFFKASDGRQARINSVPMELKGEIGAVASMANIYKRPKFIK